jgi:hypothetical protein
MNKMRLKFTKMHGLGNDFFVLDATRAPLELNRGQLRRRGRRHPARAARSVRDSHYARRRPQYIMGG